MAYLFFRMSCDSSEEMISKGSGTGFTVRMQLLAARAWLWLVLAQNSLALIFIASRARNQPED